MSTIAGMSRDEIENKWREANNNGHGFAPDGELEYADHIGRTESLDVWRLDDGRVIAVGDAHGQWAQVIEEAE